MYRLPRVLRMSFAYRHVGIGVQAPIPVLDECKPLVIISGVESSLSLYRSYCKKSPIGSYENSINETDQRVNNINDKTVVEYAENVRLLRGVETILNELKFKYGSNADDVILRELAITTNRNRKLEDENTSLRKDIASVQEQLNKIKFPTQLRNEIEFYEDLLASTFAPLESDLKGYKGDARNVRSRTLKWMYILSLDHPSVRALKEMMKEEEYNNFCEAMAVLHKEVSRYLIHALKFAFLDVIPPFEVTKKEEFDKYIDVILRVRKLEIVEEVKEE